MSGEAMQNECVRRWAVFFDSLELTREDNRKTFNDATNIRPDFYIKDWDAYVGVDANVTPDESMMDEYQMICSATGQRTIYVSGFPSPNEYKAFVFTLDEDDEETLEETGAAVQTRYVSIVEGEFRECRRCPNIIFAGELDGDSCNFSFGLGHKHARESCNACGDYEPLIDDRIEKAYRAAASASLPNTESTSAVPTGNYHVIVESAHATRDRETKTETHPRGEVLIVWKLKIIGGKYDGQHLRRKQSLNQQTIIQVKSDLEMCDVRLNAGDDIIANLPRVQGVELDITISDDAARSVTFNRRLDTKSHAERGVSAEVERFPDIAAEFGEITGLTGKPAPQPRFTVVSAEDWDCHDSLLNELDPDFIIIDDDNVA
jgi:hypothetical protein